jgi:hypothetical protein
MQQELAELFEKRKEYLVDFGDRVKEMRNSVKLGFKMDLSP